MDEVKSKNKKMRKGRRRRRRQQNVNNNVNRSSYFTLYHNNIRGVLSKAKSLEAITKSVLDNVVPTGNNEEGEIPNVNPK